METDGTLIATLGSTIATDFRSLSLIAWLATAYLVATAVTQPLSGKLTDIYSRRSGLLACNFLFVLGNLVCGLAQTPEMIILGRALAGLGGGGLNTISTILATDLVPLRQRGLYQGLSNVFWGLGNGLGGVFGGYVNDIWNWRLAFLVQIPLTLGSIVLVYFNVDKPKLPGSAKRLTTERVDFTGTTLLVATLVLLLLGVNSGGNIVPWTHPLVLTSLPISALLLCAFVVFEEKAASEPILPAHLLLNRTVACACLTNWFFIMIAYALDFYTVIYFRVRCLSATEAGASLIPFSIATALGSLATGMIINKTGKYRILNHTILVLMVLATFLIAISARGLPVWAMISALGGFGLSIGGMLTTTLVALIAAVNHEQQALVTSLSYSFRSTGSVIGIALASAVFQNVLSFQLRISLGGQENADVLIDRVRNSLEAIEALPMKQRLIVRDGYMQALQATFLTLFGLALLGLLCGLLIEQYKLHSRVDRLDEVQQE